MTKRQGGLSDAARQRIAVLHGFEQELGSILRGTFDDYRDDRTQARTTRALDRLQVAVSCSVLRPSSKDQFDAAIRSVRGIVNAAVNEAR